MLQIRNKSFGSGFGSGSGLKLVSDSDPDSLHLISVTDLEAIQNQLGKWIQNQDLELDPRRLKWYLKNKSEGKIMNSHVRKSSLEGWRYLQKHELFLSQKTESRDGIFKQSMGARNRV